MRKLLSLVLTILVAVPVQTPSAAAATAADCSEKYKINVDKPYDAADAAETTQKRCKAAGGSSGCSGSYKYMWQKYREYGLRSTAICNSVISNQANLTGEQSVALKEARELSADAKDKLEELKKHQEEDMTRLARFREQNLSNAEKAAAKADAAGKKQVADLVKKIKDTGSLSKEDHQKLIKEINGKKIPDQAKDELNAAADSVRFSTMVGQDAKARGAAASTLGEQAETNGNNEKKSGSSGFGMSDAAGVLGLATAGMGLMSAMQGNKAASADSGLSNTPAGAEAPAAPSVATLPNAEVDGASVGSSTGGTSFTAPSDGQSVAKVDQPSDAQFTTMPAASLSDPKEGVLSQFGGALGGSPFSGSSTSSGGGAGMTGGGDSRTPASDEAGAGASKGALADAALLPMSGGLPGFGGGSAAAGAEASLKDLFKGDPFAMPALGAGAPGAAADLGMGLGETTLDAADSALSLSADADSQSGLIPGANDGRTLFARVKDFHKRCVKKGLVTSEAGGKI